VNIIFLEILRVVSQAETKRVTFSFFFFLINETLSFLLIYSKNVLSKWVRIKGGLMKLGNYGYFSSKRVTMETYLPIITTTTKIPEIQKSISVNQDTASSWKVLELLL
jgi:hypothetical protein